jgi:predicted metal-dependent hydrolase
MDEPSGQPVTGSDCAGELHPLALRGIQLHNQGLFFQAHECLELAWREEPGRVRDLYRGILQVSVGYYHIQRGNWTGARKMFKRCRAWLAPFPANCRGVDLAQLKQDFEAVDQALIRLGPGGIARLDPAMLKPVVVIASRSNPSLET